jgi:hypothetical protein
MKTNRFLLILGLSVTLTLFCGKKDKVTNPVDTRAGHQIGINTTEANPYGLDSLYVSPGDSIQLQAKTLLPANPPDYEWSVGDAAVFQLIPHASDSSIVLAIAAGDSGSTTTITIKDLANSQDKTITVKLAVWGDVDRFTFVSSLNKHHYFVSKGVADWATAKTRCEDDHGHLVTITSEEENAVVKKAVDKIKDEVWIGLRFQYIYDPLHPNDRSKDLKWTQWITGEPVDYKNWDSGKPDFTTYNQDWETRYFACMVTTGKWVNRRAMTKYYVLEIP